METNKRRKLKSDEGSQAPVAGNKADINVNTNTPWNDELLRDVLRNHISSKLENASARLVCKLWSTALLVPILRLTTVKLKQDRFSTSFPKCCAIDAHALGINGAKALAEALKVNAAITSVTLNNNNVGDDGAKALADALKDNSAIISINLRNNKVGVDAAKALADALKVNSAITSIDLRNNNVGDELAAQRKSSLFFV